MTSSSLPQATPSMKRRSFLGLIAGGIAGSIAGGGVVNYAAETQLNAPMFPLGNVVQMPPVSITTASGLRIHAIQTGFVAVKQAHRQLVGPDETRLFSIAADRQWTGWMPIHTWVIEHPEGIIVVDSGETHKINDPSYVECDPVTAWVYSNNLRFAVNTADELPAQLRALNIDPADVRILVQTHLHSDHMGNIGSFPNAEIYVPEADYPNGLGVLRCHFPPSFAPKFAAWSNRELPGLQQAHALTRDGNLMIVPTPGHSMGHQSVLLREDGRDYIFAGDTSFDEAQLREGIIGGIVADTGLARATLVKLQTYLKDRPTVYLPSHDPNSPARLSAGQISTI